MKHILFSITVLVVLIAAIMALDVGAGRIRIVGLGPTPTSGAAEVGAMRLHIAADAPVGATQTVTLTGEIDQGAEGIVALEPLVASVGAVSGDGRLYLPSIRRRP